MRSTGIKGAALAVLAAAGAGYVARQNNRLSVTRLEYLNEKLSPAFSGFTVAQISDLHGKTFGKDQKKLLALLQKEKPDIIVMTGDFIDSNHRSCDASAALAKGAAAIAPVYWVPGNHEAKLPVSYARLRRRIELSGATLLENSGAVITRGSQSIRILGILDPLFVTSRRFGISDAIAKELIKIALGGEKKREDEFVILLSHRPELLNAYIETGMDLVFSGHAHGGQWRFLGRGVYAPDQGLFPQFTAGAYRECGTTMVVSRGLGNVFPVRIANRPDLVIVTFGGEI